MEQIESIKRVIQFPKLEPPPADFLVQMDNYAKEAPRSLDDVPSKKVLLLKLLRLACDRCCAAYFEAYHLKAEKRGIASLVLHMCFIILGHACRGVHH